MHEDKISRELSDREKGLTRRDFLKMGAASLLSAVFNYAVGGVIEKRQIELPKTPNSYSEYQINWNSRPWVWINLALAAKHLNGLIIQPGQSLSVIEAIGLDKISQLPPENTDPQIGYIVAQMASGLDGLGYGLCLASTALFRASLASPLHITEHGTHYDQYPDYFKDFSVGTDAAVYYPGPNDPLPKTDLVLENPTAQPIQIVFEVTDIHGYPLEVPDEKLSPLIYKGAFADHGSKLARRIAGKLLGIKIPPAAFPEYALGNKKIAVKAACAIPSGSDAVHYEVQMADPRPQIADPKNVQFSRTLTIRDENGLPTLVEEYFQSQYNRMPPAVLSSSEASS